MHRCVEYTISTGQTDMQLQNADRITCNINNSAVSSFASFLRSQTIPHFIVSLSTLHNFLSVVLEATSFIGLSSASQPLFVETLQPPTMASRSPTDDQRLLDFRNATNFRSVKRADPSIIAILETSVYSVIYHYDERSGRWEKQKQEGPLFVVKR